MLATGPFAFRAWTHLDVDASDVQRQLKLAAAGCIVKKGLARLANGKVIGAECRGSTLFHLCPVPTGSPRLTIACQSQE